MTIHLDAVTPVLAVDDVVAIAADVWACYLGDADSLGRSMARIGGVSGYVATIGITGTWNGHVILELSSVAAVRAARAMVATDDVSSADISDALGELVNMVGGNIKGLVPQPSALGLPLVFHGAGVPALGRDVVSTCVADLDWLGEPLRISVWESAQTGTEG